MAEVSLNQLSLDQLQTLVVIVSCAVIGIGATIMSTSTTTTMIVVGGALLNVGMNLMMGGFCILEVKKI